jgi:hypothetical protein
MIKRASYCSPATPPVPPERGKIENPKGSEISEQIGRRLRAMFEDVVGEPVPERFRELLEQLGSRSAKS